MSVKIKNIDTNEIVEIKMIDPPTGTDWAADYIGNANDPNLQFACHEDHKYEADEKTVEWWTKQCAAYEAANNRLYNVCRDNDVSPEAAWRDIAADFEDEPRAMQDVADMIESGNW